ncbi:TPA: DUF551 domain-containing protein [Klebsiella pneumoniae]|nr:DUF551 domain-containing protein [Klebsiella pneumoniae]MCU8606769.1 DUF551 domain-containing protein [Klebsiella pneumoniae]
MTNNQLNRERLEKIKSWRETYGAGSNVMLPAEEAEELARIALAAMDSEPVAYISKSDFDAGYPHVLARRDFNKACTMAVYAAQPAPIVEREPIAWLNDAYLARGVVDGEAGSEDAGPGYIPVYRHAQPAPVVSAELLHTAASAIEDLLTTKDRTGACVWFDLPFRLRSAANAQPAPVVPDAATAIRACLSEFPESARDIVEECADIAENACRAAMLQAGNSPAQSDCCPAQNVVVPAQSPIDHGYRPECECSGCKATSRICAELAGNPLVIPDGYVMVPKEPTDEMIAAAMNCEDVLFNSDDSFCVQFGNIYEAMLAAAPQSPGSEPATVPGKWIPVSEQLPEDSGRYWCYVEEQNDLGKSHYQWNCSWNGDRWWVESEGGGIVTHWMPLPAAPQEVNRE